MSFITEFYLGNIIPSDRGFKPGSEYDKVLSAVLEREQLLENELTEEQKKLYKAMIEANDEFVFQSVMESFTDGFRLGAGFMLDTFVIDDDSTTDFHKSTTG